MTPFSQDDSAPINKRGRKGGGVKPGENQSTAPLDAVPQRMHPNDENDGIVAEAARADPSKLGGDEDAMMYGDEILFAHQSMIVEEGHNDCLCDIYVCKATSDPDTLYYYQAMRQSDANEFRVAMWQEWKNQKRNGNFNIIRRSEVTKGATFLPSVWQLHRKREVSKGKIKKYKAR